MLWGEEKKQKQIGTQLRSKQCSPEPASFSFQKCSLGISLFEATCKTQWFPPVSFMPLNLSCPSPLGWTRTSTPPVALWLREPTSLPTQPPCQSDSLIFPEGLFLEIPCQHLLEALHPLGIQSRRHWNLCRPTEAELLAHRADAYKYPQKSS